MTAKEITARKSVAAQTTDALVESMSITDKLIDQGVSTKQHITIATARGWMIDELCKRGEEARIGLAP
jgi:hypothetical protein